MPSQRSVTRFPTIGGSLNAHRNTELIENAAPPKSTMTTPTKATTTPSSTVSMITVVKATQGKASSSGNAVSSSSTRMAVLRSSSNKQERLKHSNGVRNTWISNVDMQDMNFRPSFLHLHAHEEYHRENDDDRDNENNNATQQYSLEGLTPHRPPFGQATGVEALVTPHEMKERNREATLSQLANWSCHAGESGEAYSSSPKRRPGSCSSTAGPFVRELRKLRSKRESKLLRMHSKSYSYNCSRFMRNSTNKDSRSTARMFVDVTLIGTWTPLFSSEVMTVLGYVHAVVRNESSTKVRASTGVSTGSGTDKQVGNADVDAHEHAHLACFCFMQTQ